MKSSNSQQNFTSTNRYLSDYLENEYVEELGPGVVLSSSSNTRKQIYGDSVAKRRYEDMTPCRIEAEIHHEESGKFSYFREQKKRRPPEADNPMQFQESFTTATPVQVEGVQREFDELQVRSSEIARRSCSVSGVEVTPDICGESDLTAENQMAEESSRSSNNDGCSKFESAVESVSKGPNTEFRSVSSLGVLHCFMERTYGGREVSLVTSSEEPGQMTSLLLRNDAQNTTMDTNETREGGIKAGSHQLRSGSSEAPSSVTSFTVPSQLWRRNKQEWLQLGVGSSGRGTPANPNVLSELYASEKGQHSPLGQDLLEERSSFKRRITTSIGNTVAADCEANSNRVFPERSVDSPGDWQLRRVLNGIPPQLEVCPSVTGDMNPATLGSAPISGMLRNSDAISEVVEAVEQPDLCIFGRRLVQRGTARQELVLAPLRSGTAEPENDRGLVRLDNAFELSRDRGSFQADAFSDHRGHCFGNATRRGPEIQNRAPGPLSLSTPTTDAHLTLPPAVAVAGPSTAHDTFQRCRDNPSSSLSNLQQRREDLSQLQVGYSWLPPPATDSAPKLIPTANNFQGWISSELTSTMKLTGALSNNNARLDNPPNQQATRGLDEWGNLFKKVSPKMLFQSQCRDLRSSEGPPLLVESAGHETNVGSQESLMALKRAIENLQRGPQWPIAPEAMNLSIASWSLNGNLQGVSGESKLECFAGERMPSESGAAVQPSFAGDHLNVSEQLPQGRSWQPAGGKTKLHHGNVTTLRRPDPETAGKPRSHMLPPGSRGTNHAGLWFVLQSAENQSAEGGLPQISKAYLRIKDGKMPVSAVKKYLVTKLGLTSESEVEITCKGQPVVPSLPLQHVRDSIWFSSLNASNKKNQELACYGEREDSTTSASEQRSRLPAAADASIFSKDILMVLTYRRHPRSLQLSTLVT